MYLTVNCLIYLKVKRHQYKFVFYDMPLNELLKHIMDNLDIYFFINKGPRVLYHFGTTAVLLQYRCSSLYSSSSVILDKIHHHTEQGYSVWKHVFFFFWLDFVLIYIHCCFGYNNYYYYFITTITILASFNFHSFPPYYLSPVSSI